MSKLSSLFASLRLRLRKGNFAALQSKTNMKSSSSLQSTADCPNLNGSGKPENLVKEVRSKLTLLPEHLHLTLVLLNLITVSTWFLIQVVSQVRSQQEEE